jgi:hypothetical protein
VSVEARTWSVVELPEGGIESWDSVMKPEPFAVIELEPMLDALEEALSYVPEYFIRKHGLDELLQAHGRPR